MSFRDFITALPKVELNLQLTGALRRESLLLIANQNGIPSQLDDFDQWVELLRNPDPMRIDEIARVAGGWVMYPEDIALAVYDIGVALAKQNVRYAEVAIAPSDFIGSAKMNFDTFIDALNDGRDRSLRAWNVDMSWILSIPRDNPRAGDDVARWATGSAGRRGNVVAIGLAGPEDAQPLGQFHRAFATAHKKELPAMASVGDGSGPKEIREVFDELQPGRLLNVWRLAEEETLLNQVVEAGVPLVNSMTRALKTGQIKKAADIPAARLQESDAQLVLSCDNPSLYGSSLVDEYVLAREDCGLSANSLIQIARRSIELSYLEAERKASMLRDFDFLANSPQARFLDQE